MHAVCVLPLIMQVGRGASVDIPYTITINRVLAAPPAGRLSFSVSCSLNAAGSFATSVIITDLSAGATLTTQSATGQTTSFSNVAYPKAPEAPSNTPQGQIRATCVYPPPAAPVDGAPVDVIFNAGNTQEIRGSATLTDVITWPTWSSYYPTGGWLTTAPTTAVTSGAYPNQGTTVRGPFPVVYQYTYTVSNNLLCFTGAPVANVATLVAGSAGADQRTYKAEASVTLSVINCDVQPTMTIDQPNLQTSLSFAWTQALTALSPAAMTVPWGGGAAVQAQATFTRTVTAASFQASFTLTVTNPVQAPIAVTNLQLACPWGGTTLLPCGAVASGAAGVTGMFGTNQWLVVPASGSVTCMVNNLVITGNWGNDFTQPCTILSSNWLGTQVTMPGVVLNFAAPQRWQLVNNCALWSVTCNVPTGNPFYVPQIGGLPAGREVCGNTQSNAPLPPQPFSIALSGGWVGDGTQPAACAGSVTAACSSQLQLQSTQGTTQAFGGTQTNSLTVQATPTDCPKPPSPVLPPVPVVLPSPSPNINLMAVTPLITATLTRTSIRGTFVWSVNSQLTPASQAAAQGSAGVLGRYTVTAAPQTVAGTDAPQYQLEGFVTVVNPSNVAPVRVDEVYVVVDTAAVPLGCRPSLPGILSPGARVDCGFMVNYNQGGTPNSLYGRAVVVSDWGARTSSDGTPTRFSFDTADVSGARGACARVSQAFATNWFDLVQVTGVAPSFNPEQPTTVCSPATWNFDVRFTPRDSAPCGVQQVVQTVTATFLNEAGGSAQGSSTANFFVTGPTCPPAPADFLPGSSSGGAAGGATTPVSTSTGIAAGGSSSGTGSSSTVAAPGTSTSTGTAGAGAVSTGATAVPVPMPDDSTVQTLPAGLSVALSGVQAQRAATPAWDLVMQPADNGTTFTAGKKAAVGFTLSWSKSKPATDYTGTVTVINNSPTPVELDGVYINLVNILDSGTATDEGLADCPGSTPGSTAPITGSNPYTLAANGRLACKFTLRSTSSGSLVGTATATDGGDGVVSKAVPVTRLMADSGCGRLVTGLAASEVVVDGVLLAANGTSEEEVCAAGSRVVSVEVPADAKTDRGCVFPVVGIAWLKPSDVLTPGALASATANVKVAGCSSQLAAAETTAAVSGLSVSKGRRLRWAVSIKTDPPVNGTFEGESLKVLTTWQQRAELRLNVSGEVGVKGSGAVTKAKVIAIPLCGPGNNTDCRPSRMEVACKAAADKQAASRCLFNFAGVLNQPGLVLASVDQAQPAAAQPYDSAQARYGGKPAPQCAVLSEDRTLEPLDGAPAAKATATGASSLSAAPFCGAQQTRNYTLTFDGIECGSVYAFNTSATAAPAAPSAVPVTAELSFDVAC